jgi:uncharacterized phage protein (TIGR02218 family)
MEQEVTTLATCCVIWPYGVGKDPIAFTDHDCDLIVDGITYSPLFAMSATSINQNLTLSVDNLEITSFFAALGITDAGLRSGQLDVATLDLFLVNWEDPSMGVVYLAQGWSVGRFDLNDHVCQIEMRSLTQKLQVEIGDTYSETCRAKLGDAQCGVALNVPAFNTTGVVGAALEGATQRFNSSHILDLEGVKLTGGTLIWTKVGSANYQLTMEIKSAVDVDIFDHTIFTLLCPMPFPIEVDDTFHIDVGCDKTINMCRNRFANAINFRGEPFVPTEPEAMSTIAYNPTSRTPWGH